MSWIEDVNEEVIRLNTSQKSLRKFGLLVGVVFSLLSLWMAYKNQYAVVRLIIGTIGVLLLSFGLVLPKVLKPVYKIWMGSAFAMGWVVSRAILLVAFFVLITPLGVAGRMFGKQFLDIKKNDQREDYWIKRKKDKVNYEKLY